MEGFLGLILTLSAALSQAVPPPAHLPDASRLIPLAPAGVEHSPAHPCAHIPKVKEKQAAPTLTPAHPI